MPVTVPTPLSIEIVGAGVPDTDHARVEDCPVVILLGVAVKEFTAGATLAGLVVAETADDGAEVVPTPSNAAAV